MQIWLQFGVVLSIRILLRLQILIYFYSNQRQHLDDNDHRLLSLCYSLGMFLSLFGYTLAQLLNMILIRLRNNQVGTIL